MYLLFAVINDEDLLDELIMGWLDIGVEGATVVETTDLLQMISNHIPIFAGFRSLSSGGSLHNKTLFTAIEGRGTLDQAVAYLEDLCLKTGRPHQGVYFVAPLVSMGRLGLEVDPAQQQSHVEKKVGRPLKKSPDKS